jgi:hypothetical protein
MIVMMELFYGTQKKREKKENTRASAIWQNTRCEGRGYKYIY